VITRLLSLSRLQLIEEIRKELDRNPVEDAVLPFEPPALPKPNSDPKVAGGLAKP
jgi:hypothetical protein